MKVLLWLVGGGVAIVLILFIVGLAIDEGGTVPERIERECKRTYGSQGDAAVTECRLKMSVRYLQDSGRDQENKTYGRIR